MSITPYTIEMIFIYSMVAIFIGSLFAFIYKEIKKGGDEE